MYPGGQAFRLTHPKWGQINNTNPRRKPERNPPIWAKLSTCGRIPTAKFITMIKIRVIRAANCTIKKKENKLVRLQILHSSSGEIFIRKLGNYIYLICIYGPVCDQL